MLTPPHDIFSLSAEAVSGISGSISIACWVVVFTPQIAENARRGLADGLSLAFVAMWLTGDIFNVLGALFQHVLPTMIILAVYYAFADIVLLSQCLYYRNRRPPVQSLAPDADGATTTTAAAAAAVVSADELSPLLTTDAAQRRGTARAKPAPAGVLRAVLLNSLAVASVCGLGVAGWYIGQRSSTTPRTRHGAVAPRPPLPLPSPSWPAFSPVGQFFGYLCALLYLASRLPQLVLNHRRRSTAGIAPLFFVFACVGNVSFVLSILAYAPGAAGRGRDGEGGGGGGGDGDSRRHDCPAPCSPDSIYWRHLAVNASWLLGSAGTLLLDFVVFAQFFWYRHNSAYPAARQVEQPLERDAFGP